MSDPRSVPRNRDSQVTFEPALTRHGFGREFDEVTRHNRVTALLREQLAPDELTRLLAEGAELSPEAAVALAVRP